MDEKPLLNKDAKRKQKDQGRDSPVKRARTESSLQDMEEDPDRNEEAEVKALSGVSVQLGKTC
jgi:hypothetical protein